MPTTAKKWIGVLGIGLGIIFAAIDFSIVNTAIPAIQQHFSAPMSELQWIMAGLGLTMTSFLVTMGRIADRYGHKKVFIAGQVVFALASLLCGLAPRMFWLIAGRVAQGLSGAIILPVSMSLMVNQFSALEKGKAIGIWTSLAGMGMALGPVFGGLFVSFLSWRWIFFINLPIMAVSIGILLWSVAESRNETHETRIDWAGLFLLVLSIATLVLGIVEGPTWGWDSPATLSCFGLAVIGIAVLTILERKSAAPIFPHGLFRSRTFVVCATSNFGFAFTMWVLFFLIPLYLDNIRGELPYQTGLILVTLAGPFVLISSLVGHYATTTGPKVWMLLGSGLSILATTSLTYFSQTTPLWWILTSLFTLGLALGTLWPPSTTFALSTLPKRLAGTASGTLTTLQELGGSVGVAIGGTLFRIMDWNIVSPELQQAGLELSRQDQATIRSLLSEPDAIPSHLKGVADSLPLFQEGFLAGFSSAMWLLAGLSAALFLLILLFLKGGKQQAIHTEDIDER